MPLNNLRSAWRQLKIMNGIQLIESNEILSIIEDSRSTNSTDLPKLLLRLAALILVTFICQAG